MESKFLTIFVVLFFVLTVVQAKKCYRDNGFQASTNQVDGCNYCFYRKQTILTGSNNQSMYYQMCLQTSSVSYMDVEGTTHKIDSVNHCRVETTQLDKNEAYLCDSDLCNDRCGAEGYALGFSLLIPALLKLLS